MAHYTPHLKSHKNTVKKIELSLKMGTNVKVFLEISLKNQIKFDPRTYFSQNGTTIPL